MKRHVLARNAEIATADASVANEQARGELGGIDWNGETEPLRGRIVAVFTPTTSPRELTSGPPDLPGINALSFWIT